MLDRVTGMQVFARVAALSSLSAAARALGMSQTMATKHIAATEERLGVKLLHRTTRRLTLTEAGRRYLDAVERILVEVEEAEAAASADRVEVRGTLRINVPVSFGVREIAPLVAEFTRSYPSVTIDLGLNDRVVDLIEEGWDMAVRIGRLAEVHHDCAQAGALPYRPLCGARLSGGKRHAARRRRPRGSQLPRLHLVTDARTGSVVLRKRWHGDGAGRRKFARQQRRRSCRRGGGGTRPDLSTDLPGQCRGTGRTPRSNRARLPYRRT